jgi:hypothetical protein
METRTITLNGGPFDGETRYVPIPSGPDYWVFEGIGPRCPDPKWWHRRAGAFTSYRYTQEPERPDQYQYNQPGD